MKQLVMKFIWAFFWLFFGLVVAYSNNVIEPIQIAAISLISLLTADGIKFIVKKIASHALT